VFGAFSSMRSVRDVAATLVVLKRAFSGKSCAERPRVKHYRHQPIRPTIFISTKQAGMLFRVVLLMSAAIGSLVLLNVSLVTLIFSACLCVFTFLYAAVIAPVLAVFYVLTGKRSSGESLVREASKRAWAPFSWARPVIASMWARLFNYLSEDDTSGPSDRFARDSAIVMLLVTAAADIVALAIVL